MAMKVPAERKKIEESEFESADGGMSTGKALEIATIAAGSFAVVAGTVYMAKAFAGNGQQPNNPPVAHAPQDLNEGFVSEGPLSF